MSTYLWGVVGLAPLGSLMFGTLAERWQAPRAVLFGAGVCVVSAVVMLARFPEVKKLE
jgi:hypothetical protein